MYLKPKGYSVVSDGWGIETRQDTFTCRHHGAPGCQGVVFVETGTNPNEFWCRSCMAPICPACKRREWQRPADKPCEHFERNLAHAEGRDQMLRDMGLL